MNQYPYGHYGHYPPPQPPPKKGLSPGVWLLIVLVPSFFAIAIINSIANKKSSNETTATAATVTVPGARGKAAAPITYESVSAKQLITDYEGNEVRGDNAWKGHDVAVEGVVESIDKGPLGGLYVRLGTGERYSFHSVHVGLKKSEEGRAASLNKGETHVFKGRVQGFILGSVSIQDATVE